MDKSIQPVKVSDLRLEVHSFNRHNVTVPAAVTSEDLEDPAFWAHVGTKLQMTDEIRVVADDYSFVAYVFVTYAMGSIIRCKVISMSELDVVDPDAVDGPTSAYEVKFRGPRKWSIIVRESGDIFKEDIPTQAEAIRELDDLRKALAA